MHRTALIVAALIVALAVPAGAAVAQSQSQSTTTQARPGSTSGANESRIGGRGGFGRRSSRPTVRRSRPGTQTRRPAQRRRPLFGHGFFGSMLRFLGIAYLVNLLFGWGPGGSPLGLLIVLGVILWLATRRRRRRPLYY